MVVCILVLLKVAWQAGGWMSMGNEGTLQGEARSIHTAIVQNGFSQRRLVGLEGNVWTLLWLQVRNIKSANNKIVF